MSKLVFYTHICCLLYGVSSLKFQQEALIWLVTCTFSWCQSSEYEWNFMKFSHIPTQVLKTIFTTNNQNPIHTKKFISNIRIFLLITFFVSFTEQQRDFRTWRHLHWIYSSACIWVGFLAFNHVWEASWVSFNTNRIYLKGVLTVLASRNAWDNFWNMD